MTAIHADDTLAGLVTAHPALARDFERLGLDYCCGGAANGRRGVRPRGLDLGALLVELDVRARGRAAARRGRPSASSSSSTTSRRPTTPTCGPNCPA